MSESDFETHPDEDLGTKNQTRFYRNLGFWLLVWTIVIFSHSGFSAAIYYPEEDFFRERVLALIQGYVLFFWCFLDAKKRGFYILHSFQWMLLVTPPLGPILYYLWSRGWRGIPYLFGFMILAMGAAFLSSNLGWKLHHFLYYQLYG